MVDKHNRRFQYLRLSITEKCNFSCSYCLPNGYQGCGSQKFLSITEIQRLVTAFADLGVSKIRLTGGEPTLRPDLLEIVKVIRQNNHIKTLALTTNGFRFPSLLKPLRQAGVDDLNISLDSLNPETFKIITGLDFCDSIKKSVDQALQIGFNKVKINAVLLKGLNDQEWPFFLEWLRDRPISFRFIELMRTNENEDYFRKHFLSVKSIESLLQDTGWLITERQMNSGPAVEYVHNDYRGKVGLIAPYGENFCSGCNRLRVSSVGGLRLCLFGQGNFNLRPYLQNESQQEELKNKIYETLKVKPLSHRLHENLSGNMASFSAIGG